MNIKQIMGLFIIALTVISLTACQPDAVAPDTTSGEIGNSGDINTIESKTITETLLSGDVTTQTFQTEEEYKVFLQEAGNNINYGYNIRRGGSLDLIDFAMPMMAESADMAVTNSMTKSAGTSVQPDFSETNNQVKGVDEGDIIKTDGNYIYTVTDKTVYIVKAYPGEDAEVISTIKSDNRPTGLFIDGDKLAIFGNIEDNDVLDDAGIRIRNGMTYIDLYDVSDRENPELEKTYRFEGRFFNSRMIGDEMYILTSLYPEYRITNPLPILFEGDHLVSVQPRDIHYFDIHYQNPSFVGIHAINIQSNDRDSSKMIAVEGQPDMYMSEDNVFITYGEWINEWEIRQEVMQEKLDPDMPSHYKTLIKKIKNADSDILSKSEKSQKISNLYNEYFYGLSNDEQTRLNNKIEIEYVERINTLKYLEYTIINKVSIDNGDIKIEANGRVPGTILNQFSMDEYDNVFRIATTVQQRWLPKIADIEGTAVDDVAKMIMPKERTESINNIYTLDEDLDIIGELEGLAEGERIFSTRFIGDKLYMVTFRQVDPFFVIDLSNPKKPKSLGELKIPGFSRYLHPYDENTIIGIGRDASATGRQEGLKISLFDVSDVKNPKEIAKYVSDQKYSQSTAEYEHKAFLFDKEKELLVIPGYNYNYQNQDENYNGALVFKIQKDDIELRGLIDHSKYLDGNSYNYRYSAAVERSLYIEDLLYTKSPYAIRINDLDTLSSVKTIKLQKTSIGPIPIY